MRIALSHRSALRFWRSPRADRCAGKAPQELPAGLVPSLTVEEAFWLSDKYGVDVPVQNATLLAANRRHAKTLCCYRHSESIEPDHYIHIGKQLYVADPVLTLAHVAHTLTKRGGLGSESLAQTGWRHQGSASAAPCIFLSLLICEFCGSYTLDLSQSEGYRQRPALLSIEAIERFLAINSGFAGYGLLKKALGLADEGSNSPAETSLRMLASTPAGMGGRGLGSLRFNRQVCDRLGGAANNRYGDLVDLDRKLVIEYRSKERHEHRGSEDDERANELLDAGFRMITVGPEQLFNADRLNEVFNKVERLMGVSRALPQDFAARQKDLRALVFEANSTRSRENIGRLVPVSLLPAGVGR